MKSTKTILATMLGIAVIIGIPEPVVANTEIKSNTEIGSNHDAVHMPKYVQVWGEVAEKGDGRILIKNSTNVNKEIALNISEQTIIIDAVSGLPVSVKNIDLNQGIYAYIGQAMTFSLPPITNAKAIVVNIPQDFKAPSYIEVESVKKNSNGSITVRSEDGMLEATLDSTTKVFPYLTRNIVTLDDIKVGSNLFLWEKEAQSGIQTLELPMKVNISKCLITPSDSENSDAESSVDLKKEKWYKENNYWYYFKDSVKSKGWITDNKKWYYLGKEGVMQTGWIKDNGKWYFLSEDGSMKTGWALVKGKYYHLNANGDMAYNTTVDGYKLDENGACI